MSTLARMTLATTIAITTPRALAEEVLRNWFNDPFFQVRSAMPKCPVPLGPYATEDERLRQTHHRLERGTRCWLEKRCEKQSAYMYDRDIADAVRSRFAAEATFRTASLWVTVQGRIVFVEGCVSSQADQRAIEKMLASVPDVDRVIVFVMSRPGAAPPYRVPRDGQRKISPE